MQYVHLAGTNAKGSTAQYIAGILSQGHTCGLFTSPHIISPCERMRIGGQDIPKQQYEEYMEKARGEKDAHLFSVWTNAALLWFRDNHVEYAVIETGLGGRLDPTNIVPSKMQVLTPISYDHMALLGDTLTKIAREKCGIIKPDSVVVSHPQEEEAMRVIRAACARQNARLIVLDAGGIHVHQSGVGGQAFDFTYEGKRYRDLFIHAASPMQVQNACVALIAAVELGIPEGEIREGLKETLIAARAQVCGDIVIDGAHNPAALRELSRTLHRYFAGRDTTVLAAVMRDKDIMAITREIATFADRVVCTCADKKRGLPAHELQPYFPCAQAVEDPRAAFLGARALAKQKGGILVVCGSFYLASCVLALLSQDA
ncbi:bifunctional folylpolyglutamate synthase/dihydrofolate synthase [Christensenella timonensis]|uniref:bifunctional folylpolyglutamate synthase/dihydrofolate synthase n=1 Tax=Christensenella timonensis TaxID=1816678 RepID=UPI000829B407|nr:Mur ligase family protein [Christensenella timonensis]